MTQLKKSRNGWIILGLFLLGLLVAFGIFLFVKFRKKNDVPVDTSTDNPGIGIDLKTENERIVDNYRLIQGELSLNDPYGTVPFAQLVTAQSMFETGNYSSDLYNYSHNLFGMNFPTIRDSTANGKTPDGFASYDSNLLSIQDYILYLKAQQYPVFGDVKSFVSFLKSKGYFTDNLTVYMAGVSAKLKQLLSLINN